jgi:hypothetical protein
MIAEDIKAADADQVFLEIFMNTRAAGSVRRAHGSGSSNAPVLDGP